MQNFSFKQSPAADMTVAVMTNADFKSLRFFHDIHISSGASEILFYIDNPDRTDLEDIYALSNARVFLLDESFVGTKLRATRHTKRQSFSYRHALTQARTKWIGICDTDEFFIPPIQMKTFLEEMDEEVNLIKAMSNEAVWNVRDDMSRPFSAKYVRHTLSNEKLDRIAQQIYGDLHVIQRRGLISHKAGKYIVKNSSEITAMKVHSAAMPNQKTNRRELQLLHFDALSSKHWINKVKNKKKYKLDVNGSLDLRYMQMAYASALIDEGKAQTAFEQMYALTDDQMKLLEAHNAISRIEWPEGINPKDYF